MQQQNLLDELIIFFMERQIAGEGSITFAAPLGAREAILEEGIAFQLSRLERVQVCLFIAFDVNDETVRRRYDFPMANASYGIGPFFDFLRDDLVFYKLYQDRDPSWIQETEETVESTQAWVRATEGLKDKRGIPLVSPRRREHLRSGWERVVGYEPRMYVIRASGE